MDSANPLIKFGRIDVVILDPMVEENNPEGDYVVKTQYL